MHVVAATAANSASPKLVDLTTMDIAHRWNMDRAISAQHYQELHCYDIQQLHCIHMLQQRLHVDAESDVLKGFSFGRVDFTAGIAPFGCRMAIETGVAELQQANNDVTDDEYIDCHCHIAYVSR